MSNDSRRDAAHVGHAGVVDEHVDPAVRLDRGGDDSGDVGLDRHVAGHDRHGRALGAALLGYGLEQVGRSCGQDEVGAGLGEPVREPLPQAHRGSRDQHGLAGEVEHHRAPFGSTSTLVCSLVPLARSASACVETVEFDGGGVERVDPDSAVGHHPHRHLELLVEVRERRRHGDLLDQPRAGRDRRVAVGEADQAHRSPAPGEIDRGLDGERAPDALVDDVGTEPVRAFADRLVGLLARGDREVSTEFEGERAALFVRFDDDHLTGAGGAHPLHRAEPDRAGTLDHRDVAESQRAGSHGVEGDRGRFDLRRLFVGERGIGLDDLRRCHGDAWSEPAVRRSQRVTTERRQERHLAAVGLAAMTRRAAAARRRDRDDDAVALGERRHLGADRRHRARPLVPADRRVVRTSRLVGVDVGPADPAERDVDHDAGRRRCGVGELPQLHGVLAGDQCCQHLATSSRFRARLVRAATVVVILASERRPGRTGPIPPADPT